MRKLVTYRKVTAIHVIENADMIEEVVVDGWSMVCQKAIHSVGDYVLFFEIDSFLPESDSRFDSFMKFGTNTFEGVKGHRVKTKRMRGVYSQGILMPLSEFPEVVNPEEGLDYSETVGIVKYEKQEVVGYQGDQKGSFPWFLSKSSQERIQNRYNSYTRDYSDVSMVGTLKMDGSSITVYYVEGDRYEDPGLGVCSRNQEIKLDLCIPEEDQGKFVQGALNSNLFLHAMNLHSLTGKCYAIQGELVGPGIQGTFEKFSTYQVFAYNIFDIEAGSFVPYKEFLRLSELVDLQIVPEIHKAQKILTSPLSEILSMADGKGLKANYREGIVWKSVEGRLQFKVISNKYLNKEK